MKEMLEHFPKSSALANKYFILIEVRYGMRGGVINYDVPAYIFKPDIEDDITLGQAVLDALQLSRPVAKDEYPQLPDSRKSTELYDARIGQIMKKFGCKKKSELLRRTKYVSISKFGNLIEFNPYMQEKLNAWSGIGDRVGNVVVSFLSGPAEIGAALRLAFDRSVA